MKKKIIISVSVILASAAIVAGAVAITFGGTDADRSGLETGSASAQRIASVELAEVRTGTVSRILRLNGDIVPAVTVDSYPDVAGEVQRLHVGIGDRVRKGQVVAHVDPSRPGARYSLNAVTAPVSGTVTRVSVYEGDTVSPSSPIVTIGTLDALELVVDVPERFVGSVNSGTTGLVELPAFPGTVHPVRIAEISPLLDPTTRTKELRFRIDPERTKAEAGMFAKVTIEVERREDVIVVPVESIVTREGVESVFVVTENRIAHRREVMVGLIDRQTAEITGGLQLGDRIVVRGWNTIENGSPVRVLSPQEASLSAGGE